MWLFPAKQERVIDINLRIKKKSISNTSIYHKVLTKCYHKIHQKKALLTEAYLWFVIYALGASMASVRTQDEINFKYQHFNNAVLLERKIPWIITLSGYWLVTLCLWWIFEAIQLQIFIPFCKLLIFIAKFGINLKNALKWVQTNLVLVH